MSKETETIPYRIRCPENIPLPNKPPVTVHSDTTNWKFPKTEIQENFASPRKRKRIVTRESRYEQFLWHQFYNEYVRAIEDMAKRKDEEASITEYLDKFGQIVIPEQSEEAMKELMKKYPIYSSGAISYYNPNGKKHGVFNRSQTISRPTTMQYDTQFG